MELSSADEADNNDAIDSDDNDAISGVEASDSENNNQQTTTTTTRVGMMMAKAKGDNNVRGEGCRRRPATVMMTSTIQFFLSTELTAELKGMTGESHHPQATTRLPNPAGILRIPVLSVPVALFPQESGFLFRRNFFLPPQESCLYRAYVRSRRKLRRT